VTPYESDSRNPGLAAERTDLAWSRSGLALLTCGALIFRGLRRAPISHSNTTVGVIVLVLGALTTFLGAWHTHAVERRSGRRTNFRDLAPIALGVAAVGFAAFIVALVA
jgi:uncharacterized membrane protein YidH (DUF202 family)